MVKRIEKIELPYPLDALEPYYNRETLKVSLWDIIYRICK